MDLARPDQGAAGYVAKSLCAEAIVVALERVHAGETVVPDAPGREEGLSHREAEVVALIAKGLSNQEIATRLYLSINSVKTYIRTAYRKIGVSRRSQAVGWALAHGLHADELSTRTLRQARDGGEHGRQPRGCIPEGVAEP